MEDFTPGAARDRRRRNPFGPRLGVVGYCPGPALTSLRLGRGEALLFVAAILAGRGRAIAFGDTVAFFSSVIPAEAGSSAPKPVTRPWIPASAGMTATEWSENPNTIALQAWAPIRGSSYCRQRNRTAKWPPAARGICRIDHRAAYLGADGCSIHRSSHGIRRSAALACRNSYARRRPQIFSQARISGL
jgi:hypothetical protein